METEKYDRFKIFYCNANKEHEISKGIHVSHSLLRDVQTYHIILENHLLHYSMINLPLYDVSISNEESIISSIIM